MKQKLFNLCGFKWNQKWTLLYRGSLHGFKASDFHSKCDGISKTLTIIKAKTSGNIFGGYTEATLDGTRWKSDKNSFIFSLINSENQPVKMNITNGQEQHAIFSHPTCGPTFGVTGDAFITSANSNLACIYSNLGSIDVFQSEKSKLFLAGSYKFDVEEIEVFQLK
jgi:hypothetical protein